MTQNTQQPTGDDSRKLSPEERELIRNYVVKIGIPSGVVLTILSGIIGFLINATMNVNVEKRVENKVNEINASSKKVEEILVSIGKSKEEIDRAKSEVIDYKEKLTSSSKMETNGEIDYPKIIQLVKEDNSFSTMIKNEVSSKVISIRDSLIGLDEGINKNDNDLIPEKQWKKLGVDDKPFDLTKEYKIKIPSYPIGELESFFYPSVVSKGYLQVSIVHDHSGTVEKADKSKIVSSNLSHINGRAIEIYYR